MYRVMAGPWPTERPDRGRCSRLRVERTHQRWCLDKDISEERPGPASVPGCPDRKRAPRRGVTRYGCDSGRLDRVGCVRIVSTGVRMIASESFDHIVGKRTSAPTAAEPAGPYAIAGLLPTFRNGGRSGGVPAHLRTSITVPRRPYRAIRFGCVPVESDRNA